MAKGIYKIGVLVALGLGVAVSASGQGRGFSAPMRGFSAPLRGFSGAARGITRLGRADGLRRGRPPLVGTPLNPNFAPTNGVPGLGFDFPHLAAVSRGSRHRVGRFGQVNNGFFTPLFFDALPLYYPYDSGLPVYYAGAEEQPEFVVTPPQPVLPGPRETAPRESATPQPPPPPPPELGQLILVRSDGEVLLAVAFTVRNGQLTYITKEATRRSFPIGELDKDATRQMNDANGTSVSLPK